MKFESRRWRVGAQGAGIAALGLASSLAAHADDAAGAAADADGSGGLENVVVTARRVDETLHDVPMSMNVATAEDLQQYNVFDAKDVQALAPGLQLTNTNGRNNAASLRGITFDPDQGGNPAVDLYLNDIPVDAQTAFTAIYDLQQVEVLRGPQGSLRGRTAPGGAITLQTRRADLHEADSFVQLTGGEDSMFNAQGAVSWPIIDGRLAVRLAGVTDQNDLNHVTGINTGRSSRSETNSARVSVEWQPTDALAFHLMYQYLEAENRQNQQVVGPGNTPLAMFGDFTPSGPAADPEDYIAVDEASRTFRNKTNFFNLEFDWDLGFATLIGSGAYQKTVLTQTPNVDPANAIPGYVGAGYTRIPYPVTTGELRLVSAPADFWNWSLEAFYSKQGGTTEDRRPANQFFAPAPIYFGLYLPIDSTTIVPVDVTTQSIAASSSFQFTDELKLEFGLRYSEKDNLQTATTRAVSPGYPGNPAFGIPAIPGFDVSIPVIPADLARTENKPLTGGVTLSYAMTPDVMTYVAYARSQRDGTAGVAVPTNVTSDLVKTDEETSDAFEIGAKSFLFDQTMSVNLSVFHQTFDSFITRRYGIYYDNGTRNVFGVPDGPPDGVVDGSFDFNYNGDATVRGAELTIEGRPVANWDYSLSAAYSKARFDDAALPCNDFDGSGVPNTNGPPQITGDGNVSYCRSDDRLGNVPDWSASFNTEVRFPLTDYEPYVRTLIYHRPGFSSSLTQHDYDSITNVDLYFGVREGNWDLTLFVKNLLDEQELTNITDGNSSGATLIPTALGVPYASGYRLANTTHPMQFGASVLYRF